MSRTPPGTVIDLFSHSASDKRLKTRIDTIVAAVIKNGRLYVELGLIGPEPPHDWLSGLTCILCIPLNIVDRSVRIECVTHRTGDQFMVRTLPFSPGITDGYLPAGSTVIIRSANSVVCSRTFDAHSDKPSA